MVNSGKGRNGSGRFHLNRGNRDPFWRKGDSHPSVNKEDGESQLDTPEDIADWIARRAYELYEERGKTDGDDQADWFRAEQEVDQHIRTQGEGDAEQVDDPPDETHLEQP